MKKSIFLFVGILTFGSAVTISAASIDSDSSFVEDCIEYMQSFSNDESNNMDSNYTSDMMQDDNLNSPCHNN